MPAKLNAKARDRYARKLTTDEYAAVQEYLRLQQAVTAAKKAYEEQKALVASMFPGRTLYALLPDGQTVLHKVVTPVAAYRVAAHNRISFVQEDA